MNVTVFSMQGEPTLPTLTDAGIASPPPPPTISADAIPRGISLMSHIEFVLSLVVVLFGVFVVIMQYRLLKGSAPPPTSTDIMRVFSITLIIVGVSLAMTAGYRTEQIAPVLGVFGTIAGYLLGYSSSRTKDGAAPPQQQPEHPEAPPKHADKPKT
jgi:hypothetical protein